jgi:peptide/nickel transport system substrate-binding protein
MTPSAPRDARIMKTSRRIAAPLAVACVLSLAACAPAMPDTVVPGSEVTVGWTGEFTSANAAAAPTAGNLDIAAPTRARFGDLVQGEFVADEAFGAVTILDEDPFTVRYDLAEPGWSDGTPLDAADLLLAWAAASGLIDADERAGVDEATTDAATAVPRLDEFARAIEVTYPQAVSDWQERIAVTVPAHVVARLALGIDDPMEGKQAIITAIQGDEPGALAKIGAVWRDGFSIPETGEVRADLLLSSGPFRVDSVTRDDGGQSVSLVPNAAYRGAVTARVARIDLAPAGEDPVVEIGNGLDVAQVAPLTANRDAIDALERRDLTVVTSHDGTVWALQLNPSGWFARPDARAAFLRAIPARALIDRGGGAWAGAYTASTSMLAAPGTRAYDIVNEDAGFTAALGGSDDASLDRDAAGVPPGARVCVLYDRTSEFASGAFAALRDAAQEAGWDAADCGTDDLTAALAQGGWDAVLGRVPIPQSATQIADQWGSEGSSALVANPDPNRDALIEQLSLTTDVYAARDALAQIEAAIVGAAIALPIAVNPVVTIVDAGVIGVAPRDRAVAPLTSDATGWEAAP